jgi:hypothetical protein
MTSLITLINATLLITYKDYTDKDFTYNDFT